LIGLYSPVVARTWAASRGETSPVWVFSEATADGVILSTVDGDQYIRTAYRADRRDFETSESFTLDQAVRRTAELYPVAYNSSNSLRTGISGRGEGLYQIDIELEERSLTAFLDSDTREVFYEIHRVRLDRIAQTEGDVVTENGTNLRVTNTFPGGPLSVAVTENATG
jgi:hypothetical protein